MKFKKWLALLLALILILCTTACNYSGDDDRDNETNDSASDTLSTTGPLLYRVTDTNGNVAWVFGSIHVGRDDFYPLPDYVTTALESADAVAVEYDIVAAEKNMYAQLSAQQQCTYSFGDSIRNHISAELYNKAASEIGVYSALYDQYIPALWAVLIEQSRFPLGGKEYGVDRHIINTAYSLDLPVYDIESASQQYAMLASFSEELQVLLLEQALKTTTDEYQRNLDQLMNDWLIGNKQGIYDYACTTPTDLTTEEAVLYAEYQEKMLTNRDKNMTDFLIDAMNNGEKLFVCVGSAHVIGTNGIVEQLQAKGYTVEVVK